MAGTIVRQTVRLLPARSALAAAGSSHLRPLSAQVKIVVACSQPSLMMWEGAVESYRELDTNPALARDARQERITMPSVSRPRASMLA